MSSRLHPIAFPTEVTEEYCSSWTKFHRDLIDSSQWIRSVKLNNSWVPNNFQLSDEAVSEANVGWIKSGYQNDTQASYALRDRYMFRRVLSCTENSQRSTRSVRSGKRTRHTLLVSTGMMLQQGESPCEYETQFDSCSADPSADRGWVGWGKGWSNRDGRYELKWVRLS